MLLIFFPSLAFHEFRKTIPVSLPEILGDYFSLSSFVNDFSWLFLLLLGSDLPCTVLITNVVIYRE